MNEPRHITLYALGMHCAACELVIERVVKKAEHVMSVKASLSSNKVDVTVDSDETPEQLASRLTGLLKEAGYTLSPTADGVRQVRWNEFRVAIPIAIGFFALFILLQRLGIVNLFNPDRLDYGAIFVIGIIASLSSCMAVVGALVLSLSAQFARQSSSKPLIPQTVFHLSRLVSFIILGGGLGLLGSVLVLNHIALFVVAILVGLVMLILGLNLLDVFSSLARFQLRVPKSFAERFLRVESVKGWVTPLLFGAVTFFLPCGFTQSMQLYALSTGSVVQGALTMLVFALGTLPVLSLISFASVNFAQSKRSGIFYKSAGLIVIAFALLNLYNALVTVGWVPPIFSF